VRGRKEINLHKKTRTRKTSNRNQKKKREKRREMPSRREN